MNKRMFNKHKVIQKSTNKDPNTSRLRAHSYRYTSINLRHQYLVGLSPIQGQGNTNKSFNPSKHWRSDFSNIVN